MLFKTRFSFFAVFFVFVMLMAGCQSPRSTTKNEAPKPVQNEVIYHIFIRSFYDSNGDQHGDLKGIEQKLGYLKDLGATSILVTPIVKSVYYHNYFADDFKKIDTAYGTIEDWVSLVKAVHEKGLKIYLDQEFQYVTLKQKWFKDSFKNPDSPYSDYVIYKDTANAHPEPIVYNIDTLQGYNDSIRRVATVNLYNPQVKTFFTHLLAFWMDPNNDGNFKDGVDGFRLDHMMNDLDHKGILTDLFNRFWCPLIHELEAINPKVKFIAEQADWTKYGTAYIKQACVDKVFAFNLRGAILSFDKTKIDSAISATFSSVPHASQQIVFIENHDVPRFASLVNQNPGKLRVGAALNLLIGGTPLIYYGQELGMGGEVNSGTYPNIDGKDIPQREAFEWYKSDTGKGMALWYKNTGPWWEDSNLIPHDGLSLQEEKKDPNSLWHFYRKLLHLRQAYPTLARGTYKSVDNNNPQVISFLRHTDTHAALILINLSNQAQKVTLQVPNKAKAYKKLWGDQTLAIKGNKARLNLPAYGLFIGQYRLK